MTRHDTRGLPRPHPALSSTPPNYQVLENTLRPGSYWHQDPKKELTRSYNGRHLNSSWWTDALMFIVKIHRTSSFFYIKWDANQG